jgi:hypothetical protein
VDEQMWNEEDGSDDADGEEDTAPLKKAAGMLP